MQDDIGAIQLRDIELMDSGIWGHIADKTC